MEIILLICTQLLCIIGMVGGLLLDNTNMILFGGFLMLTASTRMLFAEYFELDDDDYIT